MHHCIVCKYRVIAFYRRVELNQQFTYGWFTGFIQNFNK